MKINFKEKFLHQWQTEITMSFEKKRENNNDANILKIKRGRRP